MAILLDNFKAVTLGPGNFEGDALILGSPPIECDGSTSQANLSSLTECNSNITLIEKLDKRMFNWLSATCVVNYLFGLYERGKYSSEQAKEILGRWNNDNYKKIGGSACGRVWVILPDIPSGRASQIGSNCMLTSFTSVPSIKDDYLSHIPLSFIKAKGREMLNAMATNISTNVEKIKQFTIDQLKELFQIKDIGKSIHSNLLCVAEEDQAKVIPPKTFGQLVDLHSIKCDTGDTVDNVGIMSSDILNELQATNIPSENIWASVTQSQVSKLAKCADIPVEKINGEAISGVKAACIQTHLGPKSTKSVSYGTSFWENAKTSELMNAIKKVPTLVNRFANEDLGLASPSVFKAILQVNEACKHLDGDLNIPEPSSSDQYDLSKKCFDSLEAKLQAQLLSLIAHSLPDDLLSDVTAEKIRNWSVKNDHSDLSGIDIVKLITSASVLKNLGKNISAGNRHPCSLIDTKAFFDDHPLFRENASTSCLDSVKFEIEAENDQQLFYRQSYSKWGRHSSGDAFLENATSADLEAIAKSDVVGKFCAELPKAKFDLIPNAALSGLGSSCIANIPDKANRLADKVKFLPADAFSKSKARDLSGLDLSTLSPEQLGAASKDVSDEGESIGKLIAPEVMVKLSPAHTAQLKAAQWSHIPKDSFEKLTEAQFVGIPASEMVLWSKEQVQSIPKTVLQKASKEQLAELSKHLDTSEVSKENSATSVYIIENIAQVLLLTILTLAFAY